MRKETAHAKLLDFLAEDEEGLFAVPEFKRKEVATTEDERLVDSFREITDFVLQNQRLPKEDFTNMSEWKLSQRLKSLKEDQDKVAVLEAHDELSLLAETKKIETIEDVFSDPELMAMLDDEEDIFTLKHVSKEIERNDYTGRQKRCADFDEFEGFFTSCQQELKTGQRKALEFAKEQFIEKGQFFILKGVMVYIAEVGDHYKKNGKTNARLRLIYENGTESDILLRSLSRELYRDGRRITMLEEDMLNELEGVTSDDRQTGFIYILRSLSKKKEIAEISDLYKIGFSRVPVQQRIKNAEKEATYLNAPVHLVSEFQCFNMNPQKLEKMLHKLFGHVCLNVDIYDESGKRSVPREWFIVPFAVIEEAISLVLSGGVVKYCYDEDLKVLVKK